MYEWQLVFSVYLVAGVVAAAGTVATLQGKYLLAWILFVVFAAMMVIARAAEKKWKRQ